MSRKTFSVFSNVSRDVDLMKIKRNLTLKLGKITTLAMVVTVGGTQRAKERNVGRDSETRCDVSPDVACDELRGVQRKC